MTEAKKRGRPTKPKAERAVSVNFTMRLRPKMMEELRNSADDNDRTISAEAERRLAQPDVGDVARMVGAAISTVERRVGRQWREDPRVAAQCRFAADAVLNLLLGEPEPVGRQMSSLQFFIDRRTELDGGDAGILTKALSATWPNLDELQAMAAEIEARITAQLEGAQIVADAGDQAA